MKQTVLRWLARLTVLAIVGNEVRGLVMALPVMYGMYQAGGTVMALWLGFCSLIGIALSVIVPLYAARFLKRKAALG